MFFVSALDCGSLSLAHVVMPPSYPTTYGSDVSFECETGYKFSERNSGAHATCNESGTWNVNATPCIRKTMHYAPFDYLCDRVICVTNVIL